MYLANKHYGTLNWGLTATPKYDITKNAMEYISTVKGEGGGLSDTFGLRFSHEPQLPLAAHRLQQCRGPVEPDLVEYRSLLQLVGPVQLLHAPQRRRLFLARLERAFEGFNVQWGWFEDDDWGAALRYKNTFNDTWLLSANVAYENFRDERLQAGGGGEATGPIIIPPSTTKQTFFQREFNEWAGSIAAKHKPSGLFAMGNFSTSESDDTNVRGFYTGDRAPDMTAWDVQAGIQKKFWAPGETAFWGGYGQVNDGWAPGSNGNGGNLGGVACRQHPEGWAPSPASASRLKSSAQRSIAGSSPWIRASNPLPCTSILPISTSTPT